MTGGGGVGSASMNSALPVECDWPAESASGQCVERRTINMARARRALTAREVARTHPLRGALSLLVLVAAVGCEQQGVPSGTQKAGPEQAARHEPTALASVKVGSSRVEHHVDLGVLGSGTGPIVLGLEVVNESSAEILTSRSTTTCGCVMLRGSIDIPSGTTSVLELQLETHGRSAIDAVLMLPRSDEILERIRLTARIRPTPALILLPIVRPGLDPRKAAFAL